MEYKLITLNRRLTGEFFFTEDDLLYDREDNGEYIFGNTAFIYKNSKFQHAWKNALINGQVEQSQKEIEEIQKFIQDIKSFQENIS